MRVKTITCHRVYNHGASLQEYALLKYLKSLGHDAETIDYTPDYLSNHHNFFNVANPKYDKFLIKWLYLLAKLPQRLTLLKRKKAFDEFENTYIPFTKKNYTDNTELKNDLPDADAFICGSDQIWNSFFQNGKDPAFYLNFVPDNKLKISYAASFAIDEIEDDLKPFVKENVERLNNISVRESSGLKILEGLDVKNAQQVLDPVFLLSPEEWKESFVTPIEEKYIFVYDCDSNPNIKKITEYTAKKHGLKIFTVNDNVTYSDKNFYLEGPKTFLSLINSAEYVISNSFHAVAFSLLFNKTFFVVDRSEKINTRMRDIMSYVGLSDFHLAEHEYKSFDNLEIDYADVKERIRVKVLESQKFLKESLSE
ncbi:PS_pyruv_trans domain-containing protein [Tenacibaculum sp. 190130A14a]|uniref:Polysaccharide pyruvyl transferase family protein n=1 Tax=Tenacibaculum polynesiense TaxID=3137857 RepID=A0ABM9PCY9_9FLAO